MSMHSNSVFKHSCIKVPINAHNRRPQPCYERSNSFVRCSMESTKEQSENSHKINKICGNNKHKKSECTKSSINTFNKDKNVDSLVNFYESIPDYKDMNHLSKQEFYNKLDMLKRKQVELNNACLDNNIIGSNWVKKDEQDDFKSNLNKTKSISMKYMDDENISLASWRKEFNKPIRNNSAKSNSVSFRSDTPFKNNYNDCYLKKKLQRSKSASPIRATIPNPFKFTQREEEERMYQDLLIASNDFSNSTNNKKNNVQKEGSPSKVRPIPATSKYPMYNQIVAEQEHQSELAKINSKIELQSQIKPFVFTTDRKSAIVSDDDLLDSNCHTIEPKSNVFRAKPCPRNLFSNYFYHKMWEDEYFRALNRKLRAEELLKMSSLPPSMRKRDLAANNCSKSSERSFSVVSSTKRTGKRRKRSKRKCKSNEYITTSTNPFEFETEKRSFRKNSKKPDSCHSNASSIKTLSSYDSTSPQPPAMYPAARPNLAANLRVEWVRKKIDEMSFNKDLTFPKEKLKRSSWGVRKTPAWKSLQYDYTNDEDISIRLATRRAEQKIRQEEHQIHMEMMKHRVRSAPLLLEGLNSSLSRTHSCTFDRNVPLKTRQNFRPNSCGSFLEQHCTKQNDYDDLDSIDKSLL